MQTLPKSWRRKSDLSKNENSPSRSVLYLRQHKKIKRFLQLFIYYFTILENRLWNDAFSSPTSDRYFKEIWMKCYEKSLFMKEILICSYLLFVLFAHKYLMIFALSNVYDWSKCWLNENFLLTNMTFRAHIHISP